MLVALATSAIFLAGAVGAAAPAAPPERPAAKMRGICWEAAGPIDRTDLEPVRDAGADWISQTPFGWASSLTATEIRYSSDRGLWGETDRGLIATASAAHALGMKSLLKPHVWVRHGAWQGDLAMENEESWNAWFASYEQFILHYARVAEDGGFDAFAVGTELGKTVGHAAAWRRLIAKVREVFHGKLTYCANWNGEPETVAFWDDLDFVGIQAYWPLATSGDPGKKQIEAAWAPIAARLEALAKRTGKPVVFTEVGYQSHDGSLVRPWVWEPEGDVNLDLQRDAFAALFETFWGRPWFGGTFVWKWHPSPPAAPRGNRDFTPQGKPALAVIKAYYTAR